MKARNRRSLIKQMLMQKDTIQVEDLMAHFDISRMTVHRDLDSLVEEGWAQKVRGGVTVRSDTQFESDYRIRQHVQVVEKKRIARAAVDLIGEGEAVAMGFGSTVMAMVPYLRDKTPLTVATASLPCMIALMENRQVELIGIGGRYIRQFDGYFGKGAEASFANLMLDVCFLSSSAMLGAQIYHQSEQVVQVKLAMMRAARRNYLLMDHTKFGHSALFLLGDLAQFDALVTDRKPDDTLCRVAEEAKTRLIIASGGPERARPA